MEARRPFVVHLCRQKRGEKDFYALLGRGDNTSQMQHASHAFKYRYIQEGTFAPGNPLPPSVSASA